MIIIRGRKVGKTPMTKDLNYYNDFVREMLDALNIPYDKNATVSINNRLSGCWGRNMYNRYTHTNTIQLAGMLFYNATDDGIIKTLLHEYIHTISTCHNHGYYFKAYANKINVAYGTDIARTASAKDVGVTEETFTTCRKVNRITYRVTCVNCGCSANYYSTKAHIVKYLLNCENYTGVVPFRCNKCNGREFKLEIIKR